MNDLARIFDAILTNFDAFMRGCDVLEKFLPAGLPDDEREARERQIAYAVDQCISGPVKTPNVEGLPRDVVESLIEQLYSWTVINRAAVIAYIERHRNREGEGTA